MLSPPERIMRSWRSGQIYTLPYDELSAQNEDLPWESQVIFAGNDGYVSEPIINYRGERISPWSFFTQFREVIFRLRGSVLPYIVFEVSISVCLSVVALYLQGGYPWSLDKETWSHLGHQFVGVLLAFLTVFRSQSAWSMYSEGEVQYNTLLNGARNIIVETLGASIEWAHNQRTATVPDEALDILRILKLYLFLCLEHVRSTDGPEAWNYSQRIAYSFATPEEIERFVAEFGHAQTGDQKQDVLAVSVPNVAVLWSPPAAGILPTNIRLDNRFRSTYADHDPSEAQGGASQSAPRSPYERAPGTMATCRNLTPRAVNLLGVGLCRIGVIR